MFFYSTIIAWTLCHGVRCQLENAFIVCQSSLSTSLLRTHCKLNGFVCLVMNPCGLCCYQWQQKFISPEILGGVEHSCSFKKVWTSSMLLHARGVRHFAGLVVLLVCCFTELAIETWSTALKAIGCLQRQLRHQSLAWSSLLATTSWVVRKD